jgi:L-asparaginase II
MHNPVDIGVKSDDANPVLVEVTRGNMVESRHRASFAVTDSSGRVVLSAGAVERPIYGRSAIKPLQAIALVESGAAEAFELGDQEIALGWPGSAAVSRIWNAAPTCRATRPP